MNKQNKKLSPEEQKELESFKKWLTDNKYSPKSQEEVAQLYKKYKSQKTAKALHGAKLNYFKSLKNQCPEGQELHYFRKGGVVKAECGCKKKEDGGEIAKAQKGTVVDKFKNRKQDQATKDSIAANKYNDQEVQTQRPGSYKKNKEGKVQWTPDRTKYPYKKGTSVKTKLDHMKCGSKIKEKKCGGAVEKFKAAKCGAKMKKHQQGGSLKRIPFTQTGTSKEGIQYKPNWYRSIQATTGVFDNNSGNYYELKTKRSLNGDIFNRKIRTLYSQSPLVSDTTYEYFPKKGRAEIESSMSFYDRKKL